MTILCDCLQHCLLLLSYSYDTWVSTSDVVDEPQEEPVHQGPWEVHIHQHLDTVPSASKVPLSRENIHELDHSLEMTMVLFSQTVL